MLGAHQLSAGLVTPAGMTGLVRWPATSQRGKARGGLGLLAGGKAELVGGLHDKVEHDGGVPVNLL